MCDRPKVISKSTVRYNFSLMVKKKKKKRKVGQHTLLTQLPWDGQSYTLVGGKKFNTSFSDGKLGTLKQNYKCFSTHSLILALKADLKVSHC